MNSIPINLERSRDFYRDASFIRLIGVRVEAAWVAVQFDARWREQFERLAQRIGRRKTETRFPRHLARFAPSAGGPPG